jgi:Domain of unknown function (DUF1814).
MQIPGLLGEVAAIVLPALGQMDVALGGGNGLRVHGVTDRPSDDLDTYLESWDADVYSRAGDLVVEVVREAGFEVEIVVSDSFFRSIWIWRRGTDRERDGVGVDIGQEYQPGGAVSLPGGGLLMDLDDIAAGKCRVLSDQRRPRDYADVACLLVQPGWGYPRLYKDARKALPTLTDSEFRQLLRGVDDVDLRDLADTGVDPEFIKSAIHKALQED